MSDDTIDDNNQEPPTNVVSIKRRRAGRPKGSKTVLYSKSPPPERGHIAKRKLSGIVDENGHDIEGKVKVTRGQERYCELRAQGFNQTQSYRMAFPDNKYPAQDASKMEGLPYIQERIAQIKYERANILHLTNPEEALARWNDIYAYAKEIGDVDKMIKAQSHIDEICGHKGKAKKDEEVSTFGSEDKDADFLKLLKALQGTEAGKKLLEKATSDK